MALLSQALHLGYLLSPHSAFQGHAAHTARWPAMLSPNGSSDTCISDGVFHIPMPCFHGAIPVYPRSFDIPPYCFHGAAQAGGTRPTGRNSAVGRNSNTPTGEGHNAAPRRSSGGIYDTAHRALPRVVGYVIAYEGTCYWMSTWGWVGIGRVAFRYVTDLSLHPERPNSARDGRAIGDVLPETARHTLGDRSGRPPQAVCTAAPRATRR